MKVYSTLEDLESTLLDVIEVEGSKGMRGKSKESSESKGVVDAAKYGASIIRANVLNSKNKRKIARVHLIQAINSKIGISIFELMKKEESYKFRPSERLSYDVAYYESLVDTLQLIRDKVDKAFE